ncbi:MAG: sulfatase-like hydrolase/transferase, partial [Candidatus Aminicenantes bacterium]|nr:sulfatase-like hydrolase/transferase [Candidatus Aminicenantes bacterium]
MPRLKTTSAGALLLVILGVGSFIAAAPPAAGKPNILLVTIDTLRPDRLSCYNSALVKTPVIDKLAARGALFEKSFAHTPLTLPSHANILTGLLPIHHGLSENSKMKLEARFYTLAESAKAAGYATGAFVGAFPLDSRFGLDQGFDVYDDAFAASSAERSPSERRASEVAAAARAWLAGQKGPWFCWVHFWDPHAPYAPPAPYDSLYAKDPYSGESAYVDAELGRILEDLKARGMETDTLVVVTADHGEALGEHGESTHGYFAYNSTLHVPLIFTGPGVGTFRVTESVGHADIFPTVCEIAGFEPPAGLAGRSLLPALKGKALPSRPVYFESLEPYYSLGCAPQRGVIDGGKKLIDSPIPELYDLAADFKEEKNLTPPADLNVFRARLDKIMKGAGSAGSGRNRPVDREALARLRSLGYTAGADLPRKTKFGPEDDLKTFFPYQQKLERGILLKDAAKFAESAAELEGLISERNHFIWAYIFLSETYFAWSKPAEAVRVLERGVRANPESYTLLAACGSVLINSGDLDSAVGVLEKALSIIDTDPQPWNNLGYIHWRKGEYNKASEYFRKAIDLDPSFAPVYANYGTLFLTAFTDRGRKPEYLPEATKNFEKAVALDPMLLLAWRGLGLARKEAGNPAGAIQAWEKAAALDPGDAFTVPALAEAYLETGQKAKARAVLQAYLKARGNAVTPAERSRIQALLDKA